MLRRRFVFTVIARNGNSLAVAVVDLSSDLLQGVIVAIDIAAILKSKRDRIALWERRY